MATPRIGGPGEPAWLAVPPPPSAALSASKTAPGRTVAPAQDENGALQLELNETEEMLLLIGELEEQLQLERQRADTLERRYAPPPALSRPSRSAARAALMNARGEQGRLRRRRAATGHVRVPARAAAAAR